ncbi:MAG TPA: tetratricopeptide repeat protein [Terriglobales bacterium]|nr:tetratricopeptide repeat protein [Terriglobales bacterium]
MTFANSCAPAVQEQFNRAVAMLHSFWYDEANRQFRAVADQDPKCAIAWWGAAMTNWHPLWEPRGPNPADMRTGSEAIAKASSIAASSKVTPREKQFIKALSAFYDNYGTVDHLERVVAYEREMETLHKDNPKDTESTVFYALALLGSTSSLPPDKTHARPRKAGALVEPLLKTDPSHPGVAHMVIHAYDYPDLAPKALDAARLYAKIAPEAPHALHMPSHIFTRLGLWQESISSNLDSAAAARKHDLPKDEYHALDYLEFAYLQTGQDQKAHDVFQGKGLSAGVDALSFQGIFSVASMPARYVLERRQWGEAAALPDPSGFPGGRYAWADASIYYARALGAARTGKLDQARRDIERLAAAYQTLKGVKEDYWAGQVDIQKTAASAWLAFGEGKKAEGLELMRKAVALDDAADKHPVTPGSIVPTRDLLGQMLIEMNKPEEALAQYEQLLSTEPNRFAALYGIGHAAELAGNSEKAREAYTKLLAMTQGSDRAEVRAAKKFVDEGGKKMASGN